MRSKKKFCASFDNKGEKTFKTVYIILNILNLLTFSFIHTTDLEDISRKIFSAHFGQLAIIEIWLSGMFFHGSRFSNYEFWLQDPLYVKPSAQLVWPIVGQVWF